MVAEGSNGYRTWGAGSYGVRFTNFLTTVASDPKAQWCVRMNRVLGLGFRQNFLDVMYDAKV